MPLLKKRLFELVETVKHENNLNSILLNLAILFLVVKI